MNLKMFSADQVELLLFVLQNLALYCLFAVLFQTTSSDHFQLLETSTWTIAFYWQVQLQDNTILSTVITQCPDRRILEVYR